MHDQSAFFPNLAPELQATALADAIEPDYPTKAAEIREWNPATRRAMRASLDQALIEKHTEKETELWTMRKGHREVQCVTVYVSVGVDLRLLERGEMLRTELFREAYADGTKAHWSFTAMYDGKDSPITGNSPYGETVAVTTVDAHTSRSVYKHNGQVSVTLNTYAHVMPSAKAEAAKKLQKLLA